MSKTKKAKKTNPRMAYQESRQPFFQRAALRQRGITNRVQEYLGTPAHRRVLSVNQLATLRQNPGPFERASLNRQGLTNRIQEYLGTVVPGRVSVNKAATMPQNYYKLPPDLHYDMIRQNYSGDGAPLLLPEFNQQLKQLYYKNHLQPQQLTPHEEDYFSREIPYGPHPLRKVRLHMNLQHTLSTIDTMTRWGCMIDQDQEQTLRLTTVQQIDRFILPRGRMFDDDYDIEANRIRKIGSEEIQWLINGIENPGVFPPANTRLGILDENFDPYDTYAELAQAMGIPELQVANFEAAPFMVSLLSPDARAEFTGITMVRRNPTRKCRGM